MKSSNNINNKALESNQIILINLILNKIGINTDPYDVQNTLTTLEKDVSFQTFLSSTPGTGSAFPTANNLKKLHQYYNCKIFQDCQKLINSSDSITLEECIEKMHNLLTDYQARYHEYESYTETKSVEIMRDIYEHDNYAYHSWKVGEEGTGEYENKTERHYGHTRIYNPAIRHFNKIQTLISTQAQLIRDITDQIKEYQSQVQSAHDLHDQKIHVLRAALRAVMGDFETIGHKDNKRTSKELVDVIALYPDALKGKVTTALLDRVLDYTHEFSNQQDMSQRTREAEKYRAYTAPIPEQMDIRSVATEIMKLSTNIEISQVVFNPPTQKFTNKYVLDGDKFRINERHQDFIKLTEKFIKLEKKYVNSNNELHIQKLNLVRALKQFLDAPNQGNFQDLLRVVKNNHRSFEGKDSETAKLFDSVFTYLGIEQVKIKPTKQQTESEVNNLKEQIDIYMANPLIDSTLKEIERLREGIIIKIGPTLQILDELKTSNENKEKLEIDKIGDTYTDGNIQYALGNKVIEFRTELAKQIEEAKALVEGFDPEKFLKVLDDIDYELRFNIDMIKENLLELKEKCEFYSNDERDIEMLKVIRDQIESENNKLLKVLEDYQQELEQIKKHVVSESVVSDLLGKVSENPNSEVGEKVRQQGKEREERELQITYQKIDEKHEERKKETEELFRDISQTGVDETYSTTYNVTRVMKEAKEEVEKSKEIFDTTFGGLTKIGEDSLKQGVKRKNTQVTKQTSQSNNELSDEEFQRMMDQAPKVKQHTENSVSKVNLWNEQNQQKSKNNKQKVKEEPTISVRKKITE